MKPKRKLIEPIQKSLIVCDNKDCDYNIPYSNEGASSIVKYINMPCPKCGENLLTPQDYLQYERLMRVIDWINKWFGWLTYFSSKKNKDKGHTIYVHVHDGIKVKVEDEKDNHSNQ